MELEHDFTVGVPVDQAWDVLLDLERIAPCMPGATLTSHTDDQFTGTVRVKMGPVTMTFAGQGRFVERDPQARRMVIEASGKDRKGGGTARATIRAALRDEGEVTGVGVHTDLVVTGRAAQFGRGMLADVSGRLLGQFTDCLAGKLGETGAPAEAAPAAGATAPAAGTTAPATGAGAPTPDGGQPAETTPAPGATAPPATTGEQGQPAPTGQAGETPPTAAAPRVTAGQPRPAEPAEAEPIDLLGVTGIRAGLGRLVPYVIVFIVGALVGAGLVALIG